MAKRCQRTNQNPLIEGQTKQWPKDTKGESESVNRRTDKAMAKSVKKPKGESESVNRKTDKAMAKSVKIP